VRALFEISTGGLSGTVADPRLIFATALKLNAAALIVCHNHPSGNLTPSHADRNLTGKIKNGGLLLDLLVSDHIILSSAAYLFLRRRRDSLNYFHAHFKSAFPKNG